MIDILMDWAAQFPGMTEALETLRVPADLSLPDATTRRLFSATFLIGAVVATAGGRLALLGATVLLAIDISPLLGFEPQADAALAGLALLLLALGLVQAIANLLFGREGGGPVMWALLVVVVGLLFRPFARRARRGAERREGR